MITKRTFFKSVGFLFAGLFVFPKVSAGTFWKLLQPEKEVVTFCPWQGEEVGQKIIIYGSARERADGVYIITAVTEHATTMERLA